MGQLSSVVWSMVLAFGLLAVPADAQDGEVGIGTPSASIPVAPATLDPSGQSADGLMPETSGAARGTQDFWSGLLSNPVLMLTLFLVVMYVLLVVPNFRAGKKTQREQEQRLSSMKKNDRVVTSFGVHGVVSAIHNDSGTVTLRIDENTNAKLTVNRETIRVVKKD